ncbi:Transmembrane component of general energizing module of ECF transporter [Lachnospiraceae bacterium TWA4]|nr:Transmembrane component of general energizing module of ECF transporter [Lachnospiraceae bacterium TWA4]
MIRKITFGQYYSVDSPIHRLDARVKLVVTFVYMITLFMINHWAGYVLATLVMGAYIKASRVPFKFIVRGLKPIIVILLFSVVFNLFIKDGTPLIEFWIIRITDAGLYKAFTMGLRLVLLILGTSIMTYTTTPNELTDALEKSLGFLNKIHMPVHEVAMIMAIALRFIPVLVEETDKIMKAQMARGANFEEGSLIERAKNMVPLLVPLFLSAFRRADELAMAMEARCYHGGEGRTKMKPLRYRFSDIVAYYLVGIYIVGILVTTLSMYVLAVGAGIVVIYCVVQTIVWLTRRKEVSYETYQIGRSV